MADRYEGFSPNVAAPAERSTPVVPGDAPLAFVPKAVLVGVAGTIVGQLKLDTVDRTFYVQAGYHPLRFKIIRAASTAQNIVALD